MEGLFPRYNEQGASLDCQRFYRKKQNKALEKQSWNAPNLTFELSRCKKDFCRSFEMIDFCPVLNEYGLENYFFLPGDLNASWLAPWRAEEYHPHNTGYALLAYLQFTCSLLLGADCECYSSVDPTKSQNLCCYTNREILVESEVPLDNCVIGDRGRHGCIVCCLSNQKGFRVTPAARITAPGQVLSAQIVLFP